MTESGIAKAALMIAAGALSSIAVTAWDAGWHHTAGIAMLLAVLLGVDARNPVIK